MQCAYIKQDGSQCWANAMSGSEYCWFHAPEVDYDRKSASQKGGQVKRAGLYCELNPIPLKTIDDVPEFLMDTIKQVRGGYMGGKLAATIGYLCAKLVNTHEGIEMRSAVKKIERQWRKVRKDLGITLRKNKTAVMKMPDAPAKKTRITRINAKGDKRNKTAK